MLGLIFFSFNSFSEELKQSQQEGSKSGREVNQESVANDDQFHNYKLPDGRVSTFEKPDWKYIVTQLPENALTTLKLAFAPDTFWPWMGILSSTAVLYKYDEDILLDVQKQGRNLGIGNEDHTKTIVEVGDINIIRVPTDTGSFMYFIGDGWTHFGIAASFLIYGTSKNDYRAWNTSYQLVHGMALSSFYNQILKHATGRQAPNNRTEPRGRWRPFPSIRTYNTQTASYDAMPTGHLMTGSLVLTIINENYPEYSSVTLPVGITLLSLLGWQMINNGVHWASDYPLGIAMGIFYGKYVANNWKFKKVSDKAIAQENRLHILPMLSSQFQGLTVSYEF